MGLTRKLIFITLVVSGLMLLTASVALAQDPEAGKTAWEEQTLCQRCHGAMGEGVFGRPLAAFTDLTAEEWIAQVRNPRNRMPSFSEAQVPDERIIDIHAYLTALPPQEPALAQIELPAGAHPGQALIVEKRCVACHTETGPVNNFVQRGETPTAEAVINQLRNPRQNMPSFSEAQVSDEEAATIAEFLASQITPQALPQSGGPGLPATTVVLLVLPALLGAVLLIGGIVLRRRVVQS